MYKVVSSSCVGEAGFFELPTNGLKKEDFQTSQAQGASAIFAAAVSSFIQIVMGMPFRTVAAWAAVKPGPMRVICTDMVRLGGYTAFYGRMPGFSLSWLNLGMSRWADLKANEFGSSLCLMYGVSPQQWVSSAIAGGFRVALTPLDTLCTQVVTTNKPFSDVMRSFHLPSSFQTGPLRVWTTSLGHFVFFSSMKVSKEALAQHTALPLDVQLAISGAVAGLTSDMVTHPFTNMKIVKQVHPKESFHRILVRVCTNPLRGFPPKMGSLPGSMALAYFTHPRSKSQEDKYEY